MSVRFGSTTQRRLAEIVARTWRLQVDGEHHVHLLRERGVPLIFTVWHSALLPPLWHRRGEGIALLVSRHHDAAPLARAALHWGYRVVEGSSTRGAVHGLRAVIRALRSGIDVAFTPDGPRGPAGVVKPGALAAAALSGAVVVPIGAAASRGWRVGSWDRFLLPAPGARVRIVYGTPMEVSCVTAQELTRLKRSLEEVQERAVCNV